MHCSINEDREKWIEHFVERETAVARNRVQDAITAMMNQHEHMGHIENRQSTTSKPEITFQEM
jgi:hypothetical protein